MKRIAILGYGAVARLHAAGLLKSGGVALHSVFGPNTAKARDFAEAFNIPHATGDIAAALLGADAAIVCSPSPRHFEQAREAVERVPAVLVELPACGSVAEARALAQAASQRGTALHCAHTSRYLTPYRRISEWIRERLPGPVLQVRYARSVPPREHSWVDDALLHHAEHPLDLFLLWFGDVRPLGSALSPKTGPPQDAALLAELPSGVPLSVSISYSSRIGGILRTIICKNHTVETDGFSFIRSDCAAWNQSFDGQREYESAIGEQDRAFLSGQGIPWIETMRLTSVVERFRVLARSVA